MKPTLKDLAKKAGVSVSTTSRVLNEDGYVSVEAKEKVLKAASELSYTANYFARGLKGKNPGIVGLVNKDYLHPFFSTISDGIEEEARKHNLTVISVCSKGKSSQEYACIEMLLSRSVDQIIFATATDVTNIEVAQSLGVQCILIERDLGYTQADRILNNNIAAGELIATTFFEASLDRVGVICIDPAIGSIERDRYLGFVGAVSRLGLTFNDEWDQHSCKDYNSKEGYLACERIFSMPRDQWPEALMVGSDYLLVGILEYFYEHDITVPKDISLVSADNFYTQIMRPKIDSIDYSLGDIGKEAIKLILEHRKLRQRGVEDTNQYQTLVIEPVYVKRSSVKMQTK